MVNAEEATRVLENMKLTPEEVGRFEKAFKDPKFMDMMREYAEELRDPKHMAETEAYLKQLEEQGRTQEVYGKDVELVLPKAGFTVKAITTGKDPGKKVFINVCHSDKIDRATSTKVDKGSTWDIPYSLSNPKEDKDRSGQPCAVHDFVIHTEAFERARGSRVFRDFVATTAIDSVARQRGVEISTDKYTLPKMAYKGNNGTPTVLAFRNRKGGQGTPDSSRKGDTPSSSAPAVQGGAPIAPVGVPNDPLISSLVANASGDASSAASKAADAGPGTRSTFSFDKGSRKGGRQGQDGSGGTGPSARPSAPPGSQEETLPDGLVRPRYQLVYQETKSYSDAWTDPTIQNASANRRPSSVTITIFLHDVASASQIDLNVSVQRLQLRVEGRFWLDLELVYPVDDARGRAQFNKSKQTMEVKLPIVPPPAPPPKPFVEAAAAMLDPAEPDEASTRGENPSEDLSDDRDGDNNSTDEPEGARVDADADVPDSAPQQTGRPDQSGDAAATNGAGTTMEATSTGGGQSQQEGSACAENGHRGAMVEGGAVPQPGPGVSSASLSNGCEAEGDTGVVAAAAPALPAQPVIAPPKLVPRLRSSSVFELD
eukprot:jgi/Mesvir1/20322/Mv19912-RA.1